MKENIYSLLMITLTCSVVIVSRAKGDAMETATPESQISLETVKETMAQKNLSSRVQIDFYGKVVDQSKKPVEGVNVSLRIRDLTAMDSDKIIELKTDKSGLFSVTNEKGHFLFLESLQKDGYEFDITKNQSSFEYQKVKNHIDIPFVGDPKSPIVFYLRQQGTVDYLLTDQFRRRFSNLSDSSELFKPRLCKSWNGPYGERLGAVKDDQSECIGISCTFNEDSSKFTLLVQTISENCGVFLSEVLLYEAPEDGYQQDVIYNAVMFKTDQVQQGLYGKKFYLYVKGPGGIYYSRIDIELNTKPTTQNNQEAVVNVRGEIYTNPNGRRYLDYNKSYNNKEYLTRSLIRTERQQKEHEDKAQGKIFDEEAFKMKIDQDRKAIEEEVNKTFKIP